MQAALERARAIASKLSTATSVKTGGPGGANDYSQATTTKRPRDDDYQSGAGGAGGLPSQADMFKRQAVGGGAGGRCFPCALVLSLISLSP